MSTEFLLVNKQGQNANITVTDESVTVVVSKGKRSRRTTTHPVTSTQEPWNVAEGIASSLLGAGYQMHSMPDTSPVTAVVLQVTIRHPVWTSIVQTAQAVSACHSGICLIQPNLLPHAGRAPGAQRSGLMDFWVTSEDDQMTLEALLLTPRHDVATNPKLLLHASAAALLEASDLDNTATLVLDGSAHSMQARNWLIARKDRMSSKLVSVLEKGRVLPFDPLKDPEAFAIHASARQFVVVAI